MTAENVSATQDVASQLKATVAGLGHSAADAIDDRRAAAASGIDSAAASLHSRAEGLPGGPRAAGLAHGAADKLNSTAEYIRGHDLKAMFEDVKTLVKSNPVPALLSAAALGFVLAKAFSRRD